MPRTADDIETFLYNLNRNFDRQENTFIVSSGPERPTVVIHVDAPVVVVRVVIGGLPEDDARRLKLYRQLLELNATDLIHAAYGVSDDSVMLVAGEELENCDENELGATLNDIDVAQTRHVGKLHEIALE